MTPEILGILGIVVVVVSIGVVLYRAGMASFTGSPTISIAANDTEAKCADACRQFNARRQDRCLAASLEAVAKAAVLAAQSDYWANMGLQAAMIAAAIGASVALPWPANLIVSLVFWTIAAVLTAQSIFLLGKLNAANTGWFAHFNALSLAEGSVVDARAIVTLNCRPEAAAACLNTPNPC